MASQGHRSAARRKIKNAQAGRRLEIPVRGKIGQAELERAVGRARE